MDGKKSIMPHVYIMLIALIVLACLMTFIIPAGEFDRVFDEASGQTLVMASSFNHIENTPVAPWLIPIKFFETLTTRSVAQIIFFVLILSGAFELITQSIGIETLSANIARAFKKNSFLSISVLITLFSIAGFTMGMTTEAVMFLPITIAVVSAMGYDKVIAMSLIFVGTNIGFTAGIFNPYSVGIAQSIAELPLYSGAWMRWIVWVALLIPGCIYTHRYAIRTVGGDILGVPQDAAKNEVDEAPPKMKAGQVAALCILALALITNAFGIARYGWFLPEIAVVFLLAGVAAAFVGRLGVNKSCTLFTSGAGKIIGGVFIIGLAATIRTVLADGNILDSIANALIGQMGLLPSWLQLPGLMWGNAILDLLITSASGGAVIVMPIMVPMADVLGFSRQAVVLAYQLGDGIPNLTSPLSTTLNVAIATSGLTFGKWIKFYYPLVGIFMIIGTIIMIFAGIVGY